MKMSQNLFNQFENEISQLSKKLDIPDFKQKMLKVGNSETRIAFDILYMAQIHSKLRKEIDAEKLNDSHLETALKNILKKY